MVFEFLKSVLRVTSRDNGEAGGLKFQPTTARIMESSSATSTDNGVGGDIDMIKTQSIPKHIVPQNQA